jgi:ribonuclease P protein component
MPNPSTAHRLRKHADYQRVYKRSRKQFGKLLAYFAAPRDAAASQTTLLSAEVHGPRIGLTVPKALGKAVDRNRIKRRLREVVRTHLPLLGGVELDIVFHPKRTVLTAEFAAIEREVATIFRAIVTHAQRKAPAPAAGEQPR